MLTTYLTAIALAGLIHLLRTAERGEDLGDLPILLYKQWKNEISKRSITKFGKIVITIIWSVWVFFAWPWAIVGYIFIRFPQFIYHKMYNKD